MTEKPGKQAPAAGRDSSGGRRVLLVDDSTDMARSLAMVLELAGHSVRLAHDGPAALQEAADYHPNVVLLDIGLPGMSGHDLARQLRQLPGLDKALFIALTGYGQEEDRRRSAEAGFDRHLVKPVDPVLLKDVVAGEAGASAG